MKTIIPFLFTVLVLLTAACGRIDPVPVDHYYRLTIPATDAGSGFVTEELLHVNDFIAEGLFNERAMLYSEDESRQELKQYRYHFWATSPPDMLRDALVRYLRSKNAAPMVIADTIVHHNSLRISGRVTDFEEIRQGDQAISSVGIELRVDEFNNYTPLLVKDYTSTVRIDGNTMGDAVLAYNSAVREIYTEFLDDLREALSR